MNYTPYITYKSGFLFLERRSCVHSVINVIIYDVGRPGQFSYQARHTSEVHLSGLGNVGLSKKKFFLEKNPAGLSDAPSGLAARESSSFLNITPGSVSSTIRREGVRNGEPENTLNGEYFFGDGVKGGPPAKSACRRWGVRGTVFIKLGGSSIPNKSSIDFVALLLGVGVDGKLLKPISANDKRLEGGVEVRLVSLPLLLGCPKNPELAYRLVLGLRATDLRAMVGDAGKLKKENGYLMKDFYY